MTLRALNYGNYGIFLIMGMQDFVPQQYHRTSLVQSGVRGFRVQGFGFGPFNCGIYRKLSF